MQIKIRCGRRAALETRTYGVHCVRGVVGVPAPDRREAAHGRCTSVTSCALNAGTRSSNANGIMRTGPTAGSAVSDEQDEESWWSGDPSQLSLLEIAAAAGIPVSTAQHCGKEVPMNALRPLDPSF